MQLGWLDAYSVQYYVTLFSKVHVTVICSVQIMMRWQKINAVSGTYCSYFSSRLLFPLLPLCLSYSHGMQRTCLNGAVLTTNSIQAAQATFKSIKSLVPLLDRVLVQRFKPETVRPRTSPPFHALSDDGVVLSAKTSKHRKRPRGSSSRPRRRRVRCPKRP